MATYSKNEIAVKNASRAKKGLPPLTSNVIPTPGVTQPVEAPGSVASSNNPYPKLSSRELAVRNASRAKKGLPPLASATNQPGVTQPVEKPTNAVQAPAEDITTPGSFSGYVGYNPQTGEAKHFATEADAQASGWRYTKNNVITNAEATNPGSRNAGGTLGSAAGISTQWYEGELYGSDGHVLTAEERGSLGMPATGPITKARWDQFESGHMDKKINLINSPDYQGKDFMVKGGVIYRAGGSRPMTPGELKRYMKLPEKYTASDVLKAIDKDSGVVSKGTPATNADGTPATGAAPAEAAPGVTEPVESPTAAQRFNNEGIDSKTGKQAPGDIVNMVNSGQAFTEEDAQAYAAYMGPQAKGWHRYVGGVGGKANPSYIGPTLYSQLQGQYTPYQIDQATTRMPFGGLFWKEGMNINEIPRESSEDQVNREVNGLMDVVTGARSSADKTVKDSAKKAKDTASPVANPVTGLMGDEKTGEDIYDELYNTPEMASAKKGVLDGQEKLDEIDEQIEGLKDDIRAEVEGEAPESYITALAVVRGEPIMKARRLVERDYNRAVAMLTDLKSEASTLLQVRVQDNQNRYTRLMNWMQFSFNKDLSLAQLGMNLPEGRSITLADGTVVQGIKENDNLNVMQFTDSDRNVYVVAVDKKTGSEVYRTLLGKSPAPQGSEHYDATPISTKLQETQSQMTLDFMDKLKSGTYGTGVNADGKTFYYDIAAYNKAVEDNKGGDKWWNPTTWGGTPKKEDYMVSIGQ